MTMTMKCLYLAVALALVFSATAAAQETYSLPASAGNVTTLSGVMTGQNGDNCARYFLARTCTQAQICAAAAAPGGSGCSAAQARSAGVRIYPLTQAGREEFVTFGIALPAFLQLVNNQKAEDRRAFCEGWAATSVANRNAFCTTMGQASGCNPGC
jgi:hypothetical protein